MSAPNKTTAVMKVLTPVHIGTGNKYSGLDYLLGEKDGRLFRLTPEAVINGLNSRWPDYTTWLNKQLQVIESKVVLIEDFKKKGQIERKEFAKINLENFCQTKGISKAMFFPFSSYHLPCPQELSSDREIGEFPKQGNLGYVPGSEIKGAVRTALLYNLLNNKNNKDLIEWFNKSIKTLLNDKVDTKNERKYQAIIDSEGNKSKPNRKNKGLLVKAFGKIEDELQKKLLRTKMSGGSDQAHYDMLKFLQVGDSIPFAPADFLHICSVTPINTSNTFINWQEFLIPNKSLTLSEFKLISHKPGYQDYLDNHSFSTIQQSYLIDGKLTPILQACYEFNQAILEEEIAFYEQSHIQIKQPKSPKIINNLNKLQEINKPNSPLLRLGMGQGYLSVTINLLFKQKEFDLYDKVLIHATQNVSYDSKHGGPLPKTRRLVRYNGELWPPGWIQLQLVEKNAEIFALPKSWSPPSSESAYESPDAEKKSDSKEEAKPPEQLPPPKPELRPEFAILLEQAQRVACLPQEFGSIMQKWQALTEATEKKALAQVLLKKLETLPLKKKDKLFDYKTRLQQFSSKES